MWPAWYWPSMKMVRELSVALTSKVLLADRLVDADSLRMAG